MTNLCSNCGRETCLNIQLGKPCPQLPQYQNQDLCHGSCQPKSEDCVSERYTAIDWGYSTPAKEENWEERFDDRFNYANFCWNENMKTGRDFAENTRQEIKSFISQLLTTHGKRIREETLREAEKALIEKRKEWPVKATKKYPDGLIEQMDLDGMDALLTALCTLRGKGESTDALNHSNGKEV